MSDINIRVADIDDVKELLYMCRDMVADSLFKELGFDVRHFGEYCLNLIVTDGRDILVAEQDGAIIGAILCSVSPGVTSPKLIGLEHGFYIRPQRRSLRAARMILESYTTWAKEHGAARVYAGNSAGAYDDGFRKLLNRSGFDLAGSLMYKNL